MMSQSDELQRHLHSMPHSDTQGKLIRPRIGPFDFTYTKQRDGKRTGMAVRGDEGEERFREREFARPCSMTGGGGGDIEFAGDVYSDHL